MASKKIWLGMVAMALGASVCFAEGFELGGSALIIPEGSVFGGGLNIASTSYFTQTIGLGVFGNITYAPLSGGSLVAVDTLVGPVFKIIDNENFALPVSAGLYVIYAAAFGGGGAARGFNIGAGGNITAQVKFSRTMYFYARFQAGYGLLAGELLITPSVGIGF